MRSMRVSRTLKRTHSFSVFLNSLLIINLLKSVPGTKVAPPTFDTTAKMNTGRKGRYSENYLLDQGASHLALIPRSLAGFHEVSDEVAGHLANFSGVRSEDHSLNGPAVVVQSAKGRIGVQLHHSGHGCVGDQHARLGLLDPKGRQDEDQQSEHLQMIGSDWAYGMNSTERLERFRRTDDAVC